MAEAGTLHDAFIAELRDSYDAERQLTKARPKLAKAAPSPSAARGVRSHREETQGQIERLDQVFESIEEKARGKHCEGIAGIIEEGKRSWKRSSMTTRWMRASLPPVSAPNTTRWPPTARWWPGRARWVTPRRQTFCRKR